MSFLDRIFGRGDGRVRLQPLYAAIVAAGRRPEWYVDGKVPDTIDGRFDMIAAMLTLVLLRLEAEEPRYTAESALLAEIFVDDMDGQLREIGVGDVVVGKHIGRMMSMLGGRLGAYRAAFEGKGDLAEALDRNLYRGAAADPAALEWTVFRMRALHGEVMAMPAEALIAGQWPTA